jgi:histidinol-phosphate aminotransferase
MRRLHAGLPANVLLVLDAAYAEYVAQPDYERRRRAGDATTTSSCPHLLEDLRPRGLRLGWCLRPAGIIDVLNRLRGPFNVTLPAQIAGIAAIEDDRSRQALQAATRLSGCPGCRGS